MSPRDNRRKGVILPLTMVSDEQKTGARTWQEFRCFVFYL